MKTKPEDIDIIFNKTTQTIFHFKKPVKIITNLEIWKKIESDIYESWHLIAYSNNILYLNSCRLNTNAGYSYHALGVAHNNNGPFKESLTSGYKEYRLNGVLHRLDGPAIDTRDGNYWYVNGIELSPEKQKMLNTWYENRSK